MDIVGISINHRTAPIELREALHLNKDEIESFMNGLRGSFFSEGFILSTCNRTEIFGFSQNGDIDYHPLVDLLLKFKPVKNVEYSHFEKFYSCTAVKHLFSVATGIDSLIVGDSQILGQLREAFYISDKMDFSGTILRRLFATAMKVGRRSIKETGIGEGAVSISYAAVQVVEKIFATLSKKNALVIGAGETGELAATHLRDKGIENITIANRTLRKAEVLAKKLHANVLLFENIKEQLHQFDIVFSATSSDKLIIDKSDVKKMMKRRKGSPVCMMDIAIPRDMDASIAKLDNVFYHDIDSLNIIVDQNLQRRKKDIPLVEKIILEEMIGYFAWFNTLDVVPAIKSMREFFEDIGHDELEKIKHKITPEDFEKVEDMTRRLLGRLMHNPTMKLREVAETGSGFAEISKHTAMIKELFNLNGKKTTEE